MTGRTLSFVIRYSGSRGYFMLGLGSLATWLILALAGGGTIFVRSSFLLMSVPFGVLLRFVAQWADFIVSDRTIKSEILETLLREEDGKIVLILRQFGNDGEILMSRGRQHARRNSVIAKVCSLEQVIAVSCEQKLDAVSVSIVDQRRRYAPPGPLSMRAEDHDWKEVVGRLISEAHAIFIIASPQASATISEGLEWEVQKIRNLRRQPRTSVVLPPYDQNCISYINAFGNARKVLALLGDGDPDTRDAGKIQRTLLLHASPQVGTLAFNGPKLKRGEMVDSTHYAQCIEAALEYCTFERRQGDD